MWALCRAKLHKKAQDNDKNVVVGGEPPYEKQNLCCMIMKGNGELRPRGDTELAIWGKTANDVWLGVVGRGRLV